MEIGNTTGARAKLRIEVEKIENSGDTVIRTKENIFDGSNVLEIQYNPDNLSLGYGQKVASKKNVGKSQNTQTVIGKEDDSISFPLIFDTSLDMDAKGIHYSVKDKYISKLQKLIKYDEAENDLICLISWGSIISFSGILINMKVNYTMFSSIGVPLRAKANLTFQQKSIADNAPTSAAKTGAQKKRVRLNPKEYLGLVAALEYGNVNKWKSIASANSIDNPRIIVPGDEIVIP